MIRRLRFVILVTVLTHIATPAHASPFRYTFQFNQLLFGGVTYAADSFSFVVPNLLAFSQTAVVSPPEDLNGFAITAVSVCGSGPGIFVYCGGGNFNLPLGSVAAFSFNAPGAPAGPGVYPTDDAGRGILVSANTIFYFYVPGQLTIQDVAVPEPATLALLSLGLGPALAVRRRRQEAD